MVYRKRTCIDHGATAMRRFDNDRYYATTDPDLELLGTRHGMAKRRSRGQGPKYVKLGKRVLYLGRDLNAYLDACVIEPTTRRAGSGASPGAEDAGRAAEPAAVSA